MSRKDLDIKNTKDNYELLKKISKCGTSSTTIDLTSISKLIDVDILEALKKNAPPDFPEKYYDFKYEYEKFRDFVLSEELVNKKIVCLAGAFSSGKSSFLNSIFKKSILPSEINPSTSVPTYVINGDVSKVTGLNIFNYKMDLKEKDIKCISYGFDEIYDYENENFLNEETNLGHILKRLIIETPFQTYKNIAFLDTPGYTKPDSIVLSPQSDEKITKASLNSSDYVIWFVSAEFGGVSDKDIEFLRDIKKEIPKLFIINKCDKLSDDDLELVVEQVRTTLHIKGIPYIDILTYSKRKPLSYDCIEINEILQIFNKAKYKESFAKNFKRLFVSCRNYYENIIYNENRRLNKINTAITLTNNEIALKNLKILIADIKGEIKEARTLLKNLDVLQNEFFLEIKKISDFVSIDMPLPSDINFLKENSLDYIQLLKNYRQKHAIKKIPNVFDQIKHYYKNLNEQKMCDNIYNNYNIIFQNINNFVTNIDSTNKTLKMGNTNYNIISSDIIKKIL